MGDSAANRSISLRAGPVSPQSAKASAEDKAKEPAATRRTDGDYALSYIQRVSNGRVFYEAHGHDEKVYFTRPFLAHMLAGIQYALGDLKADDSPSAK